MAFLDYDVGDPWPVVLLQADAGLPDGDQLRPGHLKNTMTQTKVLFYLFEAPVQRFYTLLQYFFF